MNAKHKWHDEICAWAAGQCIQCGHNNVWFDWSSSGTPPFNATDFQFRIKPAPKPDVVWYCALWPEGFGANRGSYDQCKERSLNPIGIAKLTINGETGKPSVEIVE